MKFFVSILFLFFVSHISAQNAEEIDMITPSLLKAFISKNVSFPFEARKTNGCSLVIEISFEDDGTVKNFENISNCSTIFYHEVLIAISNLEDIPWIPELTDESKGMDKKILVVNYRKFVNEMPPNYLEKVEKHLEKENYKKALKEINKAIDENPYYSRNYQYRSLINLKLEDQVNSEKDLSKSEELKDQVYTISYIDLIGFTRQEKTTVIRRID